MSREGGLSPDILMGGGGRWLNSGDGSELWGVGWHLEMIIKGFSPFSRALFWSHRSGRILMYGAQDSSRSGKVLVFAGLELLGKGRREGPALECSELGG